MSNRYLLGAASLTILVAGLPVHTRTLRAQAAWPFSPPPVTVSTSPGAQRNALNNVRSQVSWLQNATRNAPSYATGGVDLLWQQFQSLRSAYVTFTVTLSPQQNAYGANELAGLGAGLDILQEAFSNYQDDLAAGRYPAAAFNDLCQVLRRATAVWLQELNQDSNRLHVGW